MKLWVDDVRSPTLGDDMRCLMNSRDDLARLICKATQNTSYKCNTACMALCNCKGGCDFCETIASYLLENTILFLTKTQLIDFLHGGCSDNG